MSDSPEDAHERNASPAFFWRSCMNAVGPARRKAVGLGRGSRCGRWAAAAGEAVSASAHKHPHIRSIAASTGSWLSADAVELVTTAQRGNAAC